MAQSFEEAERNYEVVLEAALAGLTDEWGVRAHRQHKTWDGAAYAGKITRARKAVGSYENSGQGGPTGFWFDDPTDRAAFEAEAQRLLPTIDFEREDMLLTAMLLRSGK